MIFSMLLEKSNLKCKWDQPSVTLYYYIIVFGDWINLDKNVRLRFGEFLNLYENLENFYKIGCIFANSEYFAV